MPVEAIISQNESKNIVSEYSKLSFKTSKTTDKLSYCRKLQKIYSSGIKSVEKQDSDNLIFLLKTRKRIPCISRKNKNFEDVLSNPDISSVLSIPYKRGCIRGSVKGKDNDPGRIRNMDLLKSVYGVNEREVKNNLVFVKFLGRDMLFNKKNGAAKELMAISDELTKLMKIDKALYDYLRPKNDELTVYTWIWRYIEGTERLSPHSFGIAIDIYHKSKLKDLYWRWGKSEDYKILEVPCSLINVFERHKFIWGGKWYHFDTMHFEYRPEFFD